MINYFTIADTMSNISDYLTLAEAEKLSGIRVDLLRKLCRTGKLTSTRIGGSRGPHLVLKSDLMVLREQHIGVSN